MLSYYEKSSFDAGFFSKPIFRGNKIRFVSVVQLIEMIFFNCFIFIDLSCELIGVQFISKTGDSFQTPIQL